MACIYYIKHKETGKMYIGQTVQPLEQRMKQHLAGNTEIDRALQSLGIHSFDYGVIEQCKPEELDEKEIYYIAKYNTYYNGYNNQLGGRKTGQNKYDSIIESIRQDYMNGMSMIDLNIKYRISNYTIRYFVRDIEQKIVIESKTNKRKVIICYTKDWQRIRIFKSIKDAIYFVNNQRQQEGRPIVDERNFYRTIKTACTKNGIASGYRWQYAEDVFYDGLQFNSSIDKQNYMIGLEGNCVDNIWYTVIRNSIEYKDEKSHRGICSDSTKSTTKINKDELANICKAYTVKELAEYFKCTESSIRVALKSIGRHAKVVCNSVNKQDLFDIVRRVENRESYEEIARLYGVSKDTIRMRYNRYLDSVGIHKKDTRNINGVTCKELNISFKNIKDASIFLIENNLISNININSTSYKISKALNQQTKFKGFSWVENSGKCSYYEDLTYIEKQDIINRANILVDKSKQTVSIKCVETGVQYNSLTDAAKFLDNNSNGNYKELHYTAYNISQAAKSGKPYKGYHWKLIDKQ